jgi:uncharacterized protein YcbK (DUF882 family)
VGDLSRHFSRWEFKCKCGECYKSIDPVVDIILIEMLEGIRNHFKQAVIITSGSRCVTHNNSLKNSSMKSQHLCGRAADIKVRFIEPHLVYEWLIKEYPNNMGFGNYKKFTHLDSRSAKARWGEE